MNDNYTPWYRWFRFSIWAVHAITGALALIGLFAFFLVLSMIPGLSWMVYFLPIWFAVVFTFVFLGNIIRYYKWDELKDE
jgi:hypothetical protein